MNGPTFPLDLDPRSRLAAVAACDALHIRSIESFLLYKKKKKRNKEREKKKKQRRKKKKEKREREREGERDPRDFSPKLFIPVEKNFHG